MNGKPSTENLPSFSIQNLLDQMPGHKNDVNDFQSNSVSSRYYTPAEFLSSNPSINSFSILHLNISSLSKHIDELRSLLAVLDHPFDVLAITETRLRDQNPTSNIDLIGYEFIHTPTSSHCGGAGIYVRNNYQYEVLSSYSKSIDNVSESIFIEIKNKREKPMIFGCIYKHPAVANQFLEQFLESALNEISKENKICAMAGDFNFDLLKYETHVETSKFYDLFSAYSYRPLILHPTRVTSRSNTLIDNIFINDLTCSSVGGNITSSISDHFLQFSPTDMFAKTDNHTSPQLARNYKNFNQKEFLE